MGKQWFRRCRGVCVVDTAANRKGAYKDTGSPVYVQDSLQFASFSIYTPAKPSAFLPSSFLFGFGRLICQDGKITLIVSNRVGQTLLKLPALNFE